MLRTVVQRLLLHGPTVHKSRQRNGGWVREGAASRARRKTRPNCLEALFPKCNPRCYVGLGDGGHVVLLHRSQLSLSSSLSHTCALVTGVRARVTSLRVTPRQQANTRYVCFCVSDDPLSLARTQIGRFDRIQ